MHGRLSSTDSSISLEAPRPPTVTSIPAALPTLRNTRTLSQQPVSRAPQEAQPKKELPKTTTTPAYPNVHAVNRHQSAGAPDPLKLVSEELAARAKVEVTPAFQEGRRDAGSAAPKVVMVTGVGGVPHESQSPGDGADLAATVSSDEEGSMADALADSMSAADLVLNEIQPTSRIILKLDFPGQTSGRTLRFTQKELRVVGANKVQTRIEVLDSELPNSPVIFSVKHTHGHLWERQMIVHKNLLLASILAGLPESPIEVPKDALCIFDKTENVNHMYSYMERILPHVRQAFPYRCVAVKFTCRYPYGPPSEVRLYWWRAYENGATVLQNESTGRIIVILNKCRKLTAAAETLRKALTLFRYFVYLQSDTEEGVNDQVDAVHYPGAAFFTPDPAYPRTLSAEQTAQLGQGEMTNAPLVFLPRPSSTAQPPSLPLSEPTREIDDDEIRDTVQKWAVDSRVSPWVTQFVIKTYGLRRSDVTHIRYSLDIDPTEPRALSLQVHSNKPLSRELQAFPVCLISMPLTSANLAQVRLCFLQTMWFLRKLFEVHRDSQDRSTADKLKSGGTGGKADFSAHQNRTARSGASGQMSPSVFSTNQTKSAAAAAAVARCVPPPPLTSPERHLGVLPEWRSSTHIS